MLRFDSANQESTVMNELKYILNRVDMSRSKRGEVSGCNQVTGLERNRGISAKLEERERQRALKQDSSD